MDIDKLIDQNSRSNEWYGYVPDLPDSRDHYRFSLGMRPPVELPSFVDLRDTLPGVYNQFNLGSCTAQAGIGMYEFNQNQQGLAWECMPSQLFLYYNTRVIQGTVHYDSGASIRDMIKAMVVFGICPSYLCPYEPENFSKKPIPAAYEKSKHHKALQYQRLRQDLNEIKSCLAGEEVIAFGFSVYSEFEGIEVARTGVLNMPGNKEQFRGGHAVLLVGYDDDAQRFIVRNSWGDDWGKRGHFTMPYEYVLNDDLSADFWTVKVVS